MLTVLAQLTLWKTKNKRSSVLLSWFIGIPHTGTHENTISCYASLASSSQPGVVSRLVVAYARREREILYFSAEREIFGIIFLKTEVDSIVQHLEK
jgi:hypothetical protein